MKITDSFPENPKFEPFNCKPEKKWRTWNTTAPPQHLPATRRKKRKFNNGGPCLMTSSNTP